MKSFVLLALVATVTATIYFSEDFSGDWQSRWVPSKAKESEGTQGTWKVSAGKFYGDAEADKGLQTSEDARFYQISAKFPPFSNEGKPLILQYSVKHEQNIDCGGGYIKLLPAGTDQASFNGDKDYFIMFGPDICGSSTKKTHVIFSNKGKNHLVKKDVRCETDEFTHLYTLIVNPDNTYIVNIDGKEVQRGSLKEDFDILLPREIPDPAASKPADWVDARQIPDPTDVKPADWDTVPREIVDPDAVQPSDWDTELDGVWEAPMIANPAYKGEWRARMIDNPAYKGEWVHPKIANPEFKDDDTLYSYKNIGVIGIEVWQVKAGTIFDNIVVTNDAAEAATWAAKVTKTQEGEKQAKEKHDEEERKKREAEEAAAKTDDHEGHDHDHDEL